ncbi:MAG: CCA tRNA nucleotidyltransferase [Alphaproteobacteria bacterium]|nr:CCA tRNA nucleotidyltransferase [Alphaproteobacteria bacterium]MBP9868036.1 CCA tRNA nucleotidyltransferase [Alphaproteobacteria bacterium]
MDRVSRILLPSVMTSPEVRSLFAALDPSQRGEVLFVGGCVRGAVLGKYNGDMDIATTVTPEEGMSLLTAKGFKVVPTGIEHGTLTVVVAGLPFEVTTLRRDVSTDGRRAVVAYTKDWYEDAARRDFTMNTLLADLEGNIYDPLGRGLADLEKRQVLFVGDPDQRIKEDYLRILRFFRFHALYGEGAPDAEALAACERWASHISNLSKERVTAEFLKIVGASNAVSVLTLMRRHNILNNLVTDRFDPSLMERGLALCLTEGGGEAELVARLFMVGGVHPPYFQNFEESLRLSNRLKSLMSSLSNAFERLEKIEEFTLKLLLYRYGREVAVQALRVRLAVEKEDGSDRWIKFLKSEKQPEFPVRGEDLLRAGFSSGPEMGAHLKALEKKWIESGFRLSFSELMNPS